MTDFDKFDGYHMSIRPGFTARDEMAMPQARNQDNLAERQLANKLRRDAHKKVWPETLTSISTIGRLDGDLRQRIKYARKFSGENTYTGQVLGHVIQTTGRTKREAVKRLRLLFANAGIRTQPTPFEDLLEVSHG